MKLTTAITWTLREMHAEGGEIEQVIRLIEERFEEREGEKEELRQL